MNEEQNCAVVHVLVIEDNPGDVDLMRIAFRNARLPFDLDVIGDGAHAISLLRQVVEEAAGRRPDIVLLDLYLPRCDGIEVLRAIRGCPRLEAIPVAVLTSSDSPRDRIRAAESGADRYLMKPARLEDYDLLVAAIQELCPQKAIA